MCGGVVSTNDDGRFDLETGEAEIVDGLVIDLRVLENSKNQDKEGQEDGEGVSEQRDHVDESHGGHECGRSLVMLESQHENVVVA